MQLFNSFQVPSNKWNKKEKSRTYTISNNFRGLRSGIVPDKLLFPSQLQKTELEIRKLHCLIPLTQKVYHKTNIPDNAVRLAMLGDKDPERSIFVRFLT